MYWRRFLQTVRLLNFASTSNVPTAVRFKKNRIGMIGSTAHREASQSEKAAKTVKPAMSVARTGKLSHRYSTPPQLRPSSKRQLPPITRTAPSQSICLHCLTDNVSGFRYCAIHAYLCQSPLIWFLGTKTQQSARASPHSGSLTCCRTSARSPSSRNLA